MNELTHFIEWIQNIGFIGLLIILAIPKLRQRIFGMNGYDIMKEEIAKIAATLLHHMEHEEIEMKGITKDITGIKSDISYIRGKLDQ